jgi:hypothetical protein
MKTSENKIVLAEGSDFTIDGIKLERPINEPKAGYKRRMELFTYTGAVAFGFEGERGSRDFFIGITIEDRELILTTKVLGDSVEVLLDWMNDNEAVKSLIDESVFVLDVKHAA